MPYGNITQMGVRIPFLDDEIDDLMNVADSDRLYAAPLFQAVEFGLLLYRRCVVRVRVKRDYGAGRAHAGCTDQREIP